MTRLTTKIVRNAEFMLKLSKQASASLAVQNHLDRVAHIKIMFETKHEKELNELFEQIAASAQKGIM
jgi:hypothetical protein